MAKRSSSTGGGSSLRDLPMSAIQRELARRARKVGTVQRRRDRLAAKLAKLDAQIAAMGGSIARMGRSGMKGTGMGARTRMTNSEGLAPMLHKVLSGATMGVSEAADAVQKAGYTTNAANFRTIVNACLLKHKNLFKKVSRGQYTAA
ncbi:MAG: hypothetical protein GC200_02010 [Tepidisphaera sp.]|nr:hypothetical protein [Tepidisphaera sp.]